MKILGKTESLSILCDPIFFFWGGGCTVITVKIWLFWRVWYSYTAVKIWQRRHVSVFGSNIGIVLCALRSFMQNSKMCLAHVTNLYQWSYIKIKTLQGRTLTKIFNSLRDVCGEGTMNCSTISWWAIKCKKGQKSTEDATHSRRQRTSVDATNASIIASIIDEDRRLTLQEIAREANISTMSVQCIMKDMLQKKKVCVRCFPHCLNADQCEQRVATARQLLHW